MELEHLLRDTLARLLDPAVGELDGLSARDGRVAVSIAVDPARAAALEPWRAGLEQDLAGLPGVAGASVILTARRAPPPSGTLPGVGRIIAVASGKGGVGKSTTTANLALALVAAGQRVGILDADIFGPSIPTLMGLSGPPQAEAGRMKPKRAHGLAVMSMGFLVPEGQALIWRGPMVSAAIGQFVKQVDWAPLDILLIDMPPGTGDVQLAVAGAVPPDGAVIVSTPQDLALIDARRGIAMFGTTKTPILGIVENMSHWVCPDCGTATPIFGSGGARAEAERLGVPFLGEVPLDGSVRAAADAGRPVLLDHPDTAPAAAYRAIAARLLAA